MDMGLLEAAVSEAHLAQAEGHQWLEVPEVEGHMVQASVAVAAEALHVSEAPGLEGRGFPKMSFSLIGCPLPPLNGGAFGARAGQKITRQ